MSEFSGRALADFSLGAADEFVSIAKATKENPYFELFPFAATLHFISAGLLFAFLAYYSFRVFTRVIEKEHQNIGDNLTAPKRKRNVFYKTSGWVIVISMTIMFANFVYEWVSGQSFNWWYHYRFTFWLEGISLWAFGFSWMVKGRFFDTLWLDQRVLRSVA